MRTVRARSRHSHNDCSCADASVSPFRDFWSLAGPWSTARDVTEQRLGYRFGNGARRGCGLGVARRSAASVKDSHVMLSIVDLPLPYGRPGVRDRTVRTCVHSLDVEPDARGRTHNSLSHVRAPVGMHP